MFLPGTPQQHSVSPIHSWVPSVNLGGTVLWFIVGTLGWRGKPLFLCGKGILEAGQQGQSHRRNKIQSSRKRSGWDGLLAMVPSFQVAQSLPPILTALGLMCPKAHSDTSFLSFSPAPPHLRPAYELDHQASSAHSTRLATGIPVFYPGEHTPSLHQVI